MTDAYVAGLVDGEGCIYIDKQLVPNLDVGMAANALEILRELCDEFGGSVNKFREATDDWQAGWSWSLSGKPCSELLERLLPHLRLKAAQALAVVELQKTKDATMLPGGSRTRWTPETREHGESLREFVKKLNRRGPEAMAMPEGASVLLVGDRRLLPQLTLFGETPSAESSGSWPTSGWAFSTGSVIACWTAATSECRSADGECSSSDVTLSSILEASVPARFFLSGRAASGILRRAQRRGRTLPSHLSAALAAASRTTTTGREDGS